MQKYIHNLYHKYKKFQSSQQQLKPKQISISNKKNTHTKFHQCVNFCCVWNCVEFFFNDWNLLFFYTFKKKYEKKINNYNQIYYQNTFNRLFHDHLHLEWDVSKWPWRNNVIKYIPSYWFYCFIVSFFFYYQLYYCCLFCFL